MRSWIYGTCAVLLGAAFLGVLRLPGLTDFAITLISNGVQLAAATGAALGCALAARRTEGHRRLAWAWLAVGTGSWAAGQAVWSYYEVVLAQEVPFPSLADVGFLGFPVAAAIGLVIWLGTQGDQIAARGRDLMDGAIIAGSLLVLSWVTTLGSVVAEGADSWLPLVLSLAYPVGDLILATLVLLALARGKGAERATLMLLALGLGGLAIADSAYVYLTTLGAYSSADLVSSGWVFGFLLVAAAGSAVRPEAPVHAPRHLAPTPRKVARGSVLRLSLPYLPLVAAGVTLCVSLLRAESTPRVELSLGIVLVVLVLTRQFLATLDNQRLLTALAEARDLLEQQALHDALTGLANRVLFADRLDRALLKPGASVGVLFCDIDDFKHVNDQLGHEAGDDVLRVVAKRLLTCVRATDTVARLGGDEFAILLDSASDAGQVAERVVVSMAEPIDVRGTQVRSSISVGIAHHHGTVAAPTVERRAEPPVQDREATATVLLRLADTAMYAAKGAGKGRAVLAQDAALTLVSEPLDDEELAG